MGIAIEFATHHKHTSTVLIWTPLNVECNGRIAPVDICMARSLASHSSERWNYCGSWPLTPDACGVRHVNPNPNHIKLRRISERGSRNAATFGIKQKKERKARIEEISGLRSTLGKVGVNYLALQDLTFFESKRRMKRTVPTWLSRFGT